MSYTIESDSLFIGQQRLHIDTLHSTNDHLKTIITRGESAEGLTVTTEYQTSGRGQIGNSWESNEGENLLMSVYLTPKFLSAGHYFYLNMSVCLAVVDALNFLLPGFQIKWPNDILFDGTKVAGILIESTISGAVVQSCIIGVGLNVKTKGSLRPRVVFAAIAEKHHWKWDRREYVLRIVLKSMEPGIFS